jgi:hypothetical protein
MADRFISLVNWEKLQHYKDRNPPWIKLHQEVLTSRMWVTGDDASRSLAIACMLLASRTGNKIPLDPGYIKRVAYLNQEPDFTPLVEAQFLQIVEDAQNASILHSSASTVHANARPETETEGEKRQRREEKKKPSAAASAAPAPTLAAIITLPLNGGSEYPLTSDAVKQFVELYPAVDVLQELRNMRGWLLANEKNRKTPSGILRFVNTWLSKEQNRAPRTDGVHQTAAPKRSSHFEYHVPTDLDQEAGADAWNNVLRELSRRANKHSFETWIRPLKAAGMRDGVLYVKLPSPDFREVEKKYGSVIGEVLGSTLRIEFLVPEAKAC